MYSVCPAGKAQYIIPWRQYRDPHIQEHQETQHTLFRSILAAEAEKVPRIMVSALSNTGGRTVLRTRLPARATVFPHYHRWFSETFTVLSGSIAVYMSSDITTAANLEADRSDLRVGDSITIAPMTLHKYLVSSDGPADVEFKFEPGSVNTERAMMVMRGIQGLNPEDVGLQAIVAELTDSNAVDEIRKDFEEAKAVEGWKEWRDDLVRRHATDKKILEVAKANANCES